MAIYTYEASFLWEIGIAKMHLNLLINQWRQRLQNRHLTEIVGAMSFIQKLLNKWVCQRQLTAHLLGLKSKAEAWSVLEQLQQVQ